MRTLANVALALALAVPVAAQTIVIGAPSSVVASASFSGQTGNIAPTTLYTVPAGRGGLYRVSCYLVVTTAATTSSTLPNCALRNFTDLDTGLVIDHLSVTGNSPGNIVGQTFLEDVHVVNLPAGAVPWGTLNYASSGTTPMAYAVHVKLEYLGAD